MINPFSSPISTSLTSAQIQTLWQGKKIESIASSTTVQFQTQDNQTFIVRIQDVAEILHIKTEEINPSTLNDGLQKAFYQQPLRVRVEDELTHTLGDQRVPYEWLANFPAIGKLVQTYGRFSQAQSESKLSIAALLEGKAFSDVKDSIFQGPHGEFYLLLSVELGEGAWSKYMGAINLHTLEPAAVGFVKTVARTGQQKSVEKHKEEIKQELRLKQALLKEMKPGETFPFLLPLALVEHVNSKGEVAVARLAEAAVGDFLSYPVTDPVVFKKIARDLFTGLSYMAKLGIVHRDVKPENIMILDTPQGLQAKIADWGYAALIEQEMARNPRSVGTFHYMSPRYIKGLNLVNKGMEEDNQDLILEGKKMMIDPLNDVWAMGVALCRAFTGEFPPFMKVFLDPLNEQFNKHFDYYAEEQRPKDEKELQIWLQGKQEFQEDYETAFKEALLKANYSFVSDKPMINLLGKCFTNPPPSAEAMALLFQEISDVKVS